MRGYFLGIEKGCVQVGYLLQSTQSLKDMRMMVCPLISRKFRTKIEDGLKLERGMPISFDIVPGNRTLVLNIRGF